MTPSSRRAELHRQQRHDARLRILDAASRLLEEHRWADLRLEDVMREAGLSRTAFYRHFDDRDALLLAMLDEVRVHIGATGQAWKEGVGDPVVALCAGLRELTEAMREHGRLMLAIADSSSHDPQIRAAREELDEQFAAVTAARIAADVAAGRSQVTDPGRVAAALVRLAESELLHAFGQPPYPDVAEVGRTLCEIWGATVYGREAMGQRST